ncbi:MAG: RNA polymerase sigma-70 factor [Bacteroidales bacterium]|nr:RNA polymerase sigma-70 factor [Bacteroidales bacterium]
MRKRSVNDELIQFKKIKAGDIKSFEGLFEQYYQPLCNFAYLFLKNEEQAEEVVSSVFVNIWIKRKKINIHTSLKSFLYKSTRNAVVSLIRKNKHEFVYDLSEHVKMDNITPETLLLNKELEDVINNLLGKLPKVAGLVFRMKRIDGLKYKEIAEALDISEKTVENHITNAIKKINLLLEQKPELYKYFRK